MMRPKQKPPSSDVVALLIREECDALAERLLLKNRSYGNSCVDPVRIFSRSSPIEQVNVRIDDKISRLMRGDESAETFEATEEDLLGYLLLKRVVRRSS